MSSIKAKLLKSVLSGVMVILFGSMAAIFSLNNLASDFNQVIKQELKVKYEINLMLGDFKTQVQEWKNVIIRGGDAKQREKYFARFEKQEQVVQKDVNALIKLDYIPSEIRKQLVSFKKEHQRLGQLYRQGFSDFEQQGYNTQAGDKSVSGIDRASSKLLLELSDSVNKLAAEKTNQLSEQANTLVYLAVAVLLAVFAITVFILMRFINTVITKPIRESVKIANNIADGQLENHIDVTSDDEIGVLLTSLKTMQQNLKSMTDDIRQQMEEQKVQAERNGRIKQALDNVSAQVMLTNPDNKIIYVNKQLAASMSKISSLADNDNNIGKQIDVILDEQQQQRLLTASGGQLELNIDGHIFNLVSNPVVNEQNQVTGTVFEWTDLTEQRQAELQVENIINAAVEGNLDARLDKQLFSGFMFTLADGINRMLDAIVEPIAMTAGYLDQIAKGDIPKAISDNYKGDFLTIKSSLETCTQAVNNLISDTNLLVDAATSGQLDIRADEHRHQGDFKTIIAGINATLDAIVHPISLTATFLEEIAVGNTSANVSDEYQGDFKKIQQSLQTCADSIGLLISDTNTLVDAALAGELSNRGNVEQHQGDFRSIIAGINGTLDAIVSPIQLTANYLDDIAQGNIPQHISEDYQGDFNQIRNSLITSTEAIRRLVTDANQLAESAIEGEISVRIDQSSHKGEFAEIVAGMNNTLAAVNAPIDECKAVMGSLAQGDLTNTVSGDYHGAFGELKESVNTSISNLSGLVEQIGSSAQTITGSSSNISNGVDDLSRRTEAQASSLEETAASIEELTSTVQQNSDSAQNASELAMSTNDKAQAGGELINESISAMKEIGESSDKISRIIGVINEIAFQTNLLALNAAVEAARAGEKGRGFAVVAAEVRNLAQRSGEASKDITSLINDSVLKVEEGTRLVNESGSNLGEIVASVKEVAHIMAEIAAASKEQSTGITQVNQAIMQMDQMTQQNNQLVESTSQSSGEMLQQANVLKSLMATFVTAKT